jgi:hypothetical protein
MQTGNRDSEVPIEFSMKRLSPLMIRSAALTFFVSGAANAAIDIAVGTLQGEGTVTSEGRLCGYADDSVGHTRLLPGGVIETRNAVDYSKLFPSGTPCPKTIALYHPLPRSGRADKHLFTPGQQNHVCGYFIDTDTLHGWHVTHPKEADPFFEDVFPLTTKCPSPADDSTPLSVLTPAQSAEVEQAQREMDCRNDLGGKMTETGFQECLAGRGPIGPSGVSSLIHGLDAFKGSRHWAGGRRLSVDPQRNQECGTFKRGEAIRVQVMVTTPDGFSHPADQLFCVVEETHDIYVVRNYTKDTPEPLDAWQRRHGGISDRGVLLDPSAVKNDVESIPTEVRSEEELQSFLNDNRAVLREFADVPQRYNPQLHGTVTLKFIIEPSGEISDCTVQKSELHDATFENNLVALVSTLHFHVKNAARTRATLEVPFL